MKLLAAILSLCLSACAPATQVRIAWNTVPEATSYRVWRGIDKIATVSLPIATVDLDGDSEITITAANLAGESEHSESLSLREVVLTAEESTDLKSWTPIQTIRRLEAADKKFYRIKIE